MQDFARFCNAKNDFFGGSGLKPAPNNLELKSRVLVVTKRHGAVGRFNFIVTHLLTFFNSVPNLLREVSKHDCQAQVCGRA